MRSAVLSSLVIASLAFTAESSADPLTDHTAWEIRNRCMTNQPACVEGWALEAFPLHFMLGTINLSQTRFHINYGTRPGEILGSQLGVSQPFIGILRMGIIGYQFVPHLQLTGGLSYGLGTVNGPVSLPTGETFHSALEIVEAWGDLSGVILYRPMIFRLGLMGGMRYFWMRTPSLATTRYCEYTEADGSVTTYVCGVFPSSLGGFIAPRLEVDYMINHWVSVGLQGQLEVFPNFGAMFGLTFGFHQSGWAERANVGQPLDEMWLARRSSVSF